MKTALKNQVGFVPSKTLLVLLHLAFWILFFGIIFVLFSAFLKPNIAFTRSFFLTLLLVVVYYINTLLLINILFERKKYWLYGISIVLFSLIVIKLKFQMDFVWLEKESGFLKAAGTRASHVVASLPIIFDLIFSTLLQLLLNRYKRMQVYRARLTELTSAQLNLLKGQINPHFLFNNLNNIYSLVIRKDDKAPETILMLSDLLRYVIYKGSTQKVSLTEETEQLKNLIALNRLKDNENTNILFSTEGLNKHGFIEPMILIPLVENCFKHWDGSYNKNGFIRLEMSSNEKWFCFITENSLPETPKERVEGEGGLGLENIKNRLELVYGDKVAFNISKEATMFKVKLIIEW